MKELDCCKNDLKTLKGLEKCVNLQILNCGSNQLTTLEGLEKCVNLQILNCGNNKLQTLKGLEQCINLQELYCDSNKLETLKGIEECINLRVLYCYNNQLESLEGLIQCINLQRLNCGYDNFGNIKNMINGEEYTFTEELLKYKQVYKRLTTDQMDQYYDCLKRNEHIMIEYNYNNFRQCQYFNEHKRELVEQYNLVDLYDEIYLITQNTEDHCSICIDDTFSRYIKCKNNHIICHDCYKCLINKRRCCVCRVEYDIKDMYYSKNWYINLFYE